ncbi:MAG: hypothetical protein ABII26_12435 [Pseudomonadota bacterium]
MGITRINISLPDEVLTEISGIVESRKRSRFITEAITRALKELKAQKLAMEYEEAAQEIKRINRELERSIGDGLD